MNTNTKIHMDLKSLLDVFLADGYDLCDITEALCVALVGTNLVAFQGDFTDAVNHISGHLNGVVQETFREVANRNKAPAEVVPFNKNRLN